MDGKERCRVWWRRSEEAKGKREIVSWQCRFLMVVVNKQYNERKSMPLVWNWNICKETREQTMALATSLRRETNARVRPAEHLETDGFTVKSLLKNAKVPSRLSFSPIKRDLRLLPRSMRHPLPNRHGFAIASRLLSVNFTSVEISLLLSSTTPKATK